MISSLNLSCGRDRSLRHTHVCAALPRTLPASLSPALSLCLCLCCCRIFTFTYVALLFGLMGYNVELEGLDGFNSINNMLFTTVLIMLLMPYVGISLYTADKTMYIAGTCGPNQGGGWAAGCM